MLEASKDLDLYSLFSTTIMAPQAFPPQKVDAIFLHGRAAGDDAGLMEHTALMSRLGLADSVVVVGNEGQRVGKTTPHEANPGMTYYTNRLLELGVPKDVIDYTSGMPDGTGLHTRSESDMFIDLAIRRNWKTVAAPTQPHQSLRALAGTVKAMTEAGYKVGAWYVTPLVTDWAEIVPGSQGFETKPRREHIKNEFDRIPGYIASGSIATLEQVQEYLKWRDQVYPSKGSIKFYQKLFKI